jgi:hypothetical protein
LPTVFAQAPKLATTVSRSTTSTLPSRFRSQIGRKPVSDLQVDWFMIALTAVFAAIIAYLAVWQLLL